MTRTLSIILGVILALLGLVGFSNNPLIGPQGLFVVGTVYDVLHVVLGVVLLAVAFGVPARASVGLRAIAIIIFMLGVVGVLTVPDAGGRLFGVAMINGATAWLDLLSGAAIMLASLIGRDASRQPSGGDVPQRVS